MTEKEWRMIQRSFKPTADGSCWEWTAWKDAGGYGRFMVRVDGKRVARGAHRLVYLHLVGPVPTGLVLDHTCHNPSCVNPSHLRPCTNAQNLANSIKKKPNATSRWKGVTRSRNKWVAKIARNKKKYFLGSFTTEEEAGNAYLAKAKELDGEYFCPLA